MEVNVDHLQQGLWILQLDWKENGQMYYYEKNLKL